MFVENDCSICTLGVYDIELERKPRNMIGIFIGTGIGGGLILEGKLYSGFNRTAGEVGHMVLEVTGPKCGCGNRGCFEALASRAAIFRKIPDRDQRRSEDFTHRNAGRRLGKPAHAATFAKAIKRGTNLSRELSKKRPEHTPESRWPT